MCGLHQRRSSPLKLATALAQFHPKPNTVDARGITPQPFPSFRRPAEPSATVCRYAGAQAQAGTGLGPEPSPRLEPEPRRPRRHKTKIPVNPSSEEANFNAAPFLLLTFLSQSYERVVRNEATKRSGRASSSWDCE